MKGQHKRELDYVSILPPRPHAQDMCCALVANANCCRSPMEMLDSVQVMPYPISPKPTVPNSVYVTLGPEVHEQMFRLCGQSAVKPPVLFPRRLGTHLSTH
ncbi:hypothetical protein TNCV_3809211 [Trichonephila clavipes]|nr:hypothetical protein TNCV_3809211 [Trichonephila clavipes]